jgi:hypothetical protein
MAVNAEEIKIPEGNNGGKLRTHSKVTLNLIMMRRSRSKETAEAFVYSLQQKYPLVTRFTLEKTTDFTIKVVAYPQRHRRWKPKEADRKNCQNSLQQSHHLKWKTVTKPSEYIKRISSKHIIRYGEPSALTVAIFQ